VAAIAAAAFAGEPLKLKPIAGLSRDTFEKVEALARRRAEQQRENGSFGVSLDLAKELGAFCSVSDLVAITASEHDPLSQAAFGLLRGSFSASLTKQHVAALLKHFGLRGSKKAWKALWAAHVMGQNGNVGVPALKAILDTSDDPFTRLHAAGGLTRPKAPTDAKLRRQAAQALLQCLAEDKDVRRQAHNYLSNILEPWMAQWLIERLSASDAASPLWNGGLSLLTYREPKDLGAQLRPIFLAALANPRVWTRMSGVQGLARLGLTEADAELYRRVLKDEDQHVRRALYTNLAQLKAPWAAPFLTEGLNDGSAENVGMCASGLLRLGHRPAVPELVAILRKAPLERTKPFDDGYRQVGLAASRLAGLDHDFRVLTQGVPLGPRGHATVILNRDDHYQDECRRLLTWWDTTGSKQDWNAPKPE
jgi:hypothetical protein